MKRTLHDEATGRTRTITTLGRGVLVRQRPSEIEINPEAETIVERVGRSRAAPRERSEAIRAQGRAKRERLRERLRGGGSAAFIRRALEALIDRGALDHMPEED